VIQFPRIRASLEDEKRMRRMKEAVKKREIEGPTTIPQKPV